MLDIIEEYFFRIFFCLEPQVAAGALARTRICNSNPGPCCLESRRLTEDCRHLYNTWTRCTARSWDRVSCQPVSCYVGISWTLLQGGCLWCFSCRITKVLSGPGGLPLHVIALSQHHSGFGCRVINNWCVHWIQKCSRFFREFAKFQWFFKKIFDFFFQKKRGKIR